MASLFTNKRMGCIDISIELINKNPEVVHEIFLHCIPVKSEHDFGTGSIHFMCIGDVFEEITMGQQVPKYLVEITKPFNKLEFKKI